MSQAEGPLGGMRENQSYALSSGKPSRSVSVYHVKLTDSAARAIGSFQSGEGWSSHPTICFNGDYGRISIPCSGHQQESRIFTFGVTNVARDNPHGSFDCVKQLSSCPTEELSCLGVIQKKMTVNATDDSYDKARQSMAQAEEETRSRGAIVIKHGGRYQGKKVIVRPPGPALASLSKPKHPAPSLLSNMRRSVGMSRLKKGVGATLKKSLGNMQDHPLRERVTHLLALKPYKRPELIFRLQKDGLTAQDKDMLHSLLSEVAQLNSRDSTFVLKDSVYKELRKDWPGYTTGDQQLLKRILVRRLFQPQQNLLAVPEAQVSPLRDTPNSSPAHRSSKLPLPEEYIDPLAPKKPRISHLSSRAAGHKLRSQPSQATTHKSEAEAARDDGTSNSLDPQKLFDSLSAVCQQEVDVATRLEPTDSAAQKGQKDLKEQSQADSECSPATRVVPSLNREPRKRKRSKVKEHEKERWNQKKRTVSHSPQHANSKVSLDSTESIEDLFGCEVPEDDDTPNYFLKYSVICSPGQRQSYKQDFNNEYSEYLDLHAHIDSVTRQFMELETQLKQLHHGSHKYKTVRNTILQAYCKINKSNPNYKKDKVRCEYLHAKLAHIKKLISDYDQQQLREDHSSPK